MSDSIHIVAANLNRLMEKHRNLRSGLGSNAGLAKAARVSSDTVGRLRRADGNVTLLKLSRICKALKIEVWEITHPNFSSEARLEIVSDQAEQKLLAVFRGRPETKH